jgi:energy-converting hydrogenase Eha subunit E
MITGLGKGITVRKINRSRDRFAGRLAYSQAAYFLFTGVWPLVDIRSFERMSGPKVEDWLVKSVGIQVSVVGAVLAFAANRRHLTPELEFLALASALGLAGIDVVYVGRRQINPIYLLDAAIEFGFIAGWMVLRRRSNAS